MLSALFAGVIVALSFGDALAAVSFKGVNIAGFEFGVHTDGSCFIDRTYGPYKQLRYGNNPDGAGQMIHFTSQHGMNMYRLPFAWQFLVDNRLGGTLDAKNFGDYDKLVRACLATGSHCLIDNHNFARWNGGIIGQGGPSDADFADLWSQLAKKYASENKIVFGLMNEPHDIPDIERWGLSVQAAVTAIRKAGATSQMILMPGTDYTSAQTFVSSGSAAALAKVKNLDGSNDNLIFDVHKYYDFDNSGTHSNCVSNNVDSSFAPLAGWLRSHGRQALLSETGGGRSDDSCLKYVCQALSYIESNSDVYLGYLGWSAGSFAADYILSLTPFGDAVNGWRDQEMLTKCFADAAGSGPPPKVTSTPKPLPISAPASIIGAKTFAAIVTPSPAVDAKKSPPAFNVGIMATSTAKIVQDAPQTTSAKKHSPAVNTKTAPEPKRPSPNPAPAPAETSPSTTSRVHEITKTHTPKARTSHQPKQHHQHTASTFSTVTKPSRTTGFAPAATLTDGAADAGDDDTCEV